jgi:Uma2 family endonuclease
VHHLLLRDRPVPRLARERPLRGRRVDPAPPLTLEEQEARLVTEDEKPVENLYSEKARRLVPGSLHDGWSGPPPRADGQRRPFVAMADVGLFFTPTEEPLVPDVLVSLDVSLPADISVQKGKSYFVWRYQKVPDLVMEIVSNKKGGELTTKLETYARHGVPWYVVHDPHRRLGDDVLYVWKLRGKKYVRARRPFIEPMGLGLALWRGIFEDREDTWLRWRDANGVLVPTGAEMAAAERVCAEQERGRAESAEARAEQERARAERLLAKLRAMGITDGDG